MLPKDTTGQLAIEVPAQKPKKRTRAELQSAIKSARDIMRKDAGLNGDLDRLPQLTWILFLRAFDVCVEAEREAEFLDYERAIQSPYDWESWGEKTDFTGPEFLDFVNGKLLPYLRELSGDEEGDPRNVISTIFQDVNNRMLSGTLLRDLVNVVNGIEFESADDIHTMAFVYESILKEMRDAAGDSGEFYTPRPVIRFMVEQSFLKLDESILDPACGTGGFLVEAYDKLKDRPRSREELSELHHNIRGMEKKPLPYLLGTMNLLLHGIDAPNVMRTNALRKMREESSPKHRVNVVLTNPPFGGEEEKSVAAAFDSAGVGTHETAWLFLYSVIERLKPGGRCAIVLPNGVLFGSGVGAKIKRKLMRECNLHTIVRLPQGVFAPYTQIPANLLFFEKAGQTKETWFYEIPLPEGRRGYSKTKPMEYEAFADCAKWWGGENRVGRTANEHAWKVDANEIQASGFNLDLINPDTDDELAHRSPVDIVDDLIRDEQEVLKFLQTLHGKLDVPHSASRDKRRVEVVRIGDVVRLERTPIDVEETESYRVIGMRSFGKGIIRYPSALGSKVSKLNYFTFPSGALILSNIKAWEGAISVTTAVDSAEYIASNRFLAYLPVDDRVNVSYLRHYLLSREGLAKVAAASPGGADRNRTLGRKRFEDIEIPLPSRPAQDEAAEVLDSITNELRGVYAQYVLDMLRPSVLNTALVSSL
ncbi:type I restriction enzyme M protein [Streptomyces sp. V3I8]|uniref:N-6 DNA methylase n=1 Tax=Streptomyces sp. V3I8 TaxID=3042279 RepID=UPI00278B6D96|nr:N-6 DNA methylase [Streptomyces sp. V3I8]MDQ1038563.1 type I restriction enzyme M protein [Streptomyces sp. V3I8]